MIEHKRKKAVDRMEVESNDCFQGCTAVFYCLIYFTHVNEPFADW